MWCGVEVRVPFADHELMEYVWNIPRSMKTINGVEKTVLREALVGILPEEVRTRKKCMYPVAADPSMTRSLREMIKKEILDNPEAPLLQFFDKTRSEEYLLNAPRIDNTFLGVILTTNYWLEQYQVKFVE